MAPVISPKKSWEGFAGSAVTCVVVGVACLVVYLLEGDWWVGVALGVIAVVMATLGDLCESVMKRDLGIKDMSQVIPGSRRPDGPARLAAGHGPADLAAAALPRCSRTVRGSRAARGCGRVVTTLGRHHLRAYAEQPDRRSSSSLTQQRQRASAITPRRRSARAACGSG